jgi:hypothetical protein
MSNTNVSSEQLKKATADFLNRTKPYFDVLNVLVVNKTRTIKYDITTNFYSISCGEDSEEEKELKRIISSIRDDCSRNLLKY